MPKFKKIIIEKIASSDSACRAKLAREFLESGESIDPYLDILLMKPPISTRFSWLLGDIGLIDASFSPIILSYCMDHFHEIKIPNFERVIAREAKTCAPDFPKGREAEVIDLLLEFYHNPKMIVTTRKYAKAALDKIADKYPEIRNEFE